VGAETDVAAEQVRTLAQPGQGRGVDLMTRPPQMCYDPLPTPAANHAPWMSTKVAITGLLSDSTREQPHGGQQSITSTDAAGTNTPPHHGAGPRTEVMTPDARERTSPTSRFAAPSARSVPPHSSPEQASARSLTGCAVGGAQP
jgi:hypothetical protein